MPISRRELWTTWGARLVFTASAATLTATLVGRVSVLPVHALREYHLLDELRYGRFFDLKVYRRAAEVVSHGRPLYGIRLNHGLGFTYPPLAVLMFLALRWLTTGGDETVVTLINITLWATMALAATRLSRPLSDSDPVPLDHRRRKVRIAASAWLAAGVALWVEPVTTSVGYGQVDLLISALVILDLVYGRRSRFGGLGIGLAAALKLTPLIFIPYLLFTGRGRMVVRALMVFAGAIAVAFVFVPRDAWTYWFGGKFMDVSRITGGNHLAGSGAANQSLRGALLRIFPDTPHLTVIWLLVCLLVGALGLALAVRAARRGDERWGFMLVALTGLLISPVSWTHHWVIAVAGAVALLSTGPRTRLSGARAVAAAAVGLSTGVIWRQIEHPPVWSHAGLSTLLLGNLYVVAGAVTLTAATALELRRLIRGPVLTPFFRPSHRTLTAQTDP